MITGRSDRREDQMQVDINNYWNVFKLNIKKLNINCAHMLSNTISHEFSIGTLVFISQYGWRGLSRIGNIIRIRLQTSQTFADNVGRRVVSLDLYT